MVKELNKKVILLGNGAVGKTSLIRKFVDDQFDDDYIFTIGTKVTKKEVTVGNTLVNLMIWDILGQTDFHRTQAEAFKGASGVFLVADITRTETLKSLVDYWIPEFRKAAGKVPIVFLANKSDLTDQYKFTEEEFKAFAEKCVGADEKPIYYMVSAKTGVNVEDAFKSLAEVSIDNVFCGRDVSSEHAIEFRDTGIKLTLESSKEFGFMIVYTPADEPFACMENLTCAPDAPNLYAKEKEKPSGLRVVGAGESVEGWVRYSLADL